MEKGRASICFRPLALLLALPPLLGVRSHDALTWRSVERLTRVPGA